jgi:uncharacterized protein YndB with AHSA1/START domain
MLGLLGMRGHTGLQKGAERQVVRDAMGHGAGEPQASWRVGYRTPGGGATGTLDRVTSGGPPRSSGSSDSPAVNHLRGVIHGSFTVVRRLAAPAGGVFAAFSDFSLRKRWFRIPAEPGTGHHELDFRVGGREIARGTFAPGGVPERIEYRSQFLDIVLDERIVFIYELLLDGRLRSVSLVTVELAPGADGTRLTYTEQYVLVAFTADGRDDIAEREGGTRLQLNALGFAVDHPATAA